jgi:uncharacterized protein involved in exopolysaccharide biosynthesis
MAFDYQQNSSRIVNTGDKPIRILVSPLESVVASFQNRLKVEPVSKSSVVALSITSPVIKRGRFLE